LSGKILVIDDEKSMREFLEIVLSKEGYSVSVASDGEKAVQLLEEDIFDLVISDIRMPKMSGIEVLKAVKKVSPETVVIMVTAFASTETAIEAMKEGAYNYLIKPFKVDEVKIIIKNALEKQHLRKENSKLRQELKALSSRQIIGKSESLLNILGMVGKVADTASNILVTGESGTGKELIARAIHEQSSRREMPFVTINCSALPENLLESELFGHMKGSFTGAISNKEGLFEVADGGTLFLDEIGDIAPAIQVKLLRVLQEREFRRVGGLKDIKVDVRIIAATNKDLRKAASDGSFREDLYYRLDVISFYIPPLRERKSDIPLLVNYFIEKFNQLLRKNIEGIEKDGLDLLLDQEWKGNIRELENVMERIISLSENATISRKEVLSCIRPVPSRNGSMVQEIPPEGFDLEAYIAGIEKDLLLKALEMSGGVKTEAARILHLNFRSFRYRLLKYQLEKQPSSPELN